MEKSFKHLPPMMPNYIYYERPTRLRQEGVNFEESKISITELSEKEACEYAQLMHDEFIRHWRKKMVNQK